MRKISPPNAVLWSVGLVLAAVLLAVGAPLAQAATEGGRPVQTQTIVVPPEGAIEPAMPAVPPDSVDPADDSGAQPPAGTGG